MASEPAQSPYYRRILPVEPVTGERREFVDQPADIGRTVRPVGMAGDLDLLPGRQVGIGLAQQTLGFALQFTDFIGDIYFTGIGQVAKFFNLAFQLRDGPFEIKKGLHAVRRPVPVGAAFLT